MGMGIVGKVVCAGVVVVGVLGGVVDFCRNS